MNFSIHQASHIGNRKYNQDRVAYAYSNDALLLVLADGMGGHLHGELAAGAIIDTFIESFELQAYPHIADPNAFISGTMRLANERIMNFPHDKASGSFPGSTCVAALIQDGQLYRGHAGDSRLYLLRDSAVLAKTRDHSVVQHWIDKGMMTAEEARIHPQRNQITNCLGGIEDAFHVEMGKPAGLQSGDVLLLGSDGLWGPFSDDDLMQAFATTPVDQALDNLIARALEREKGRSDNITGLVVRWGSGEIAHETGETVCHVLDIN
jgi:serine/threonine protein phosphatase PrpC